MAKLIVTASFILAVAVISGNASTLPETFSNKSVVRLVSSENVKDFLKEHPNAVELQGSVQKLEDNEIEHDRAGVDLPIYTINYSLGSRNAWDYRVAYDVGHNYWREPRDVNLSLQYPSYGVDRIVSFVDIYVRQSTLESRAYAVNGSIGHRHITVIVEARNTVFFDYDASVYGWN